MPVNCLLGLVPGIHTCRQQSPSGALCCCQECATNHNCHRLLGKQVYRDPCQHQDTTSQLSKPQTLTVRGLPGTALAVAGGSSSSGRAPAAAEAARPLSATSSASCMKTKPVRLMAKRTLNCRPGRNIKSWKRGAKRNSTCNSSTGSWLLSFCSSCRFAGFVVAQPLSSNLSSTQQRATIAIAAI